MGKDLYTPIKGMTPLKILDDVSKKAFGNKAHEARLHDNIELNFYDSGYGWRSVFDGVYMKTRIAGTYKHKTLGVKLDKDGNLDLAKLRHKYKKLIEFAKEQEELQEKIDSEKQDKRNILKALEYGAKEKFKDRSVYVSETRREYKLTFYLSYEELKEVLKKGQL